MKDDNVGGLQVLTIIITQYGYLVLDIKRGDSVGIAHRRHNIVRLIEVTISVSLKNTYLPVPKNF